MKVKWSAKQLTEWHAWNRRNAIKAAKSSGEPVASRREMAGRESPHGVLSV